MHQISRVRQWKAALHTAYGRAQPLRGPAPYHRLLTASAYGLTRPYGACPIERDSKPPRLSANDVDLQVIRVILSRSPLIETTVVAQLAASTQSHGMFHP